MGILLPAMVDLMLDLLAMIDRAITIAPIMKNINTVIKSPPYIYYTEKFRKFKIYT